MTQSIHYQSKREERDHSRKHWIRTRSKNMLGKFQTLHLMCDVKALLRYPLPFSFVDSNTLLSQASSTLNPQLSSPGIPWLSGLTNILESPIPSKLYLHSFTQWPLWASIQTHPWHVPGLNSFPQLRRKIPQPLPVSLMLNPEQCGQSCLVFVLGTAGAWPLLTSTFSTSYQGFHWKIHWI